MKDTIETLNRITNDLNTLKVNAAQAEGVCNALYKQLRDEFNVNSIEEAKELYNKMIQDADQTEQRIKARVLRLVTALKEEGRDDR